MLETMELLSHTEIKDIIKKYGFYTYDSLEYDIVNYSNEIVGALGEHLRLIIKINSCGKLFEHILFIKCVPRFDHYKAQYLRECLFFRKEFVLLNSLFSQFTEYEGNNKWRPKCLYLKDEVFVFEDVTQFGYYMRDSQNTFTCEEIIAAVEATARFHAQSFILEHKKSKELHRPYSIYEDYGTYLNEPLKVKPWRDIGRNAVINFLLTYSTYKHLPNFSKLLAEKVPPLFDRALESVKPSNKHKNVVVHRDLWSNNIIFKKLETGKLHAIIVDFQTALYSLPMHDLTSLMYFNTTKKFRTQYTTKMITLYYSSLNEALAFENLNINDFINKDEICNLYEESKLFGIIQAALIIPIAYISLNKIKEYCDGPEKSHKFDSISRSECFIETAKDNIAYRNLVVDLLDDILETYVL